MAKEENFNPEFEDLNELTDGMPDPTATADKPLPDEKPGKKKKEEKKKKERKPKERKPKQRSTQKGPGLVAAMAHASPYTVLLAISLAAILVAVFYMALGLISYGGDYKAKAAKQAAAPASVRFIEPAQTRVA
ncbi:MAG: hypothetical protein JW888_11515 [Pirellulales bacterium]|nr:hypothetical protein [Pirellulales bacterium]